MDLALLVLRVVLGLALAAHGSQKLFGWFGGGGLNGTQGFIDMLGFRPARFWAPVVAVGEFGGGVLVALGLLNPIGPLAVVAAMLTASLTAHRSKGFWNSNGGYELPLTNIAVAVAVGRTGRFRALVAGQPLRNRPAAVSGYHAHGPDPDWRRSGARQPPSG